MPTPIGPGRDWRPTSVVCALVLAATPAYATDDAKLSQYQALRDSYIERSTELVKSYRASSGAEDIESMDKDTECLAKAFGETDVGSLSERVDALLFGEEESMDPLEALLAEREGTKKPKSTTTYTGSLFEDGVEDELLNPFAADYITCDTHKGYRVWNVQQDLALNELRKSLQESGSWDAAAEEKAERQLHNAITSLSDIMAKYRGCEIESRCQE